MGNDWGTIENHASPEAQDPRAQKREPPLHRRSFLFSPVLGAAFYAFRHTMPLHPTPRTIMSLKYQPRTRSVLMCRFDGFYAPEMVKTRPVVILAKHKHNSKLVTVVPLSTTPPDTVEMHHHQLSANPTPGESKDKVVWAKCDMVYTLSTDRLELFRIRTRQGRSIANACVSDADFEAIREAVRAALGLKRQQLHSPSAPLAESL